MSSLSDASLDLTADCLGKIAQAVRPIGPCCWEATLAETLRVSRHAEFGWLQIYTPLGVKWGGVSQELLVQLLRENGLLPGQARFAIRPPHELMLLADILLDDERDIDGKLGGALAELRGAVQKMRQHGAESTTTFQEAEGRRMAPDPRICREIAQRCQSAGWPCSARDEGLAIQLDVPDTFRQAYAEVDASGSVRLAATMGPIGESETTRYATVMWLLRAACAVRLARPVAVTVDDHMLCRWEVLLDRRMEVSAIHHALTALSAVYQLCDREFQALADERISRTYLMLQE